MKKLIVLFFDIIIVLLLLTILILYSDLFLVDIKAKISEEEIAGVYAETTCANDSYVTKTDNPVLTNDDVYPNNVIGYAYFPSTEVEAPVVQGSLTDGQYVAMASGAAHDPHTPLPGVAGNTVIAGHNNRDFHTLGSVEIGDPVVVNINNNTFVYEITSSEVVSEFDVDKIFVPDVDFDMLTLYTCYPLTPYAPTFPDRLVVQAKLVEKIDYPCAPTEDEAND